MCSYRTDEHKDRMVNSNLKKWKLLVLRIKFIT